MLALEGTKTLGWKLPWTPSTRQGTEVSAPAPILPYALSRFYGALQKKRAAPKGGSVNRLDTRRRAEIRLAI